MQSAQTRARMETRGSSLRDDRYGVCARALECIDPEQHLDKLVVGLTTDRLHEIYVLIANRLIDPYKNISLGEFDRFRVSELRSKVCVFMGISQDTSIIANAPWKGKPSRAVFCKRCVSHSEGSRFSISSSLATFV